MCGSNDAFIVGRACSKQDSQGPVHDMIEAARMQALELQQASQAATISCSGRPLTRSEASVGKLDLSKYPLETITRYHGPLVCLNFLSSFANKAGTVGTRCHAPLFVSIT